MTLLRLPKLCALPMLGWRAMASVVARWLFTDGRNINSWIFTFHLVDQISFSTGFWEFGESINELNGKLLLSHPGNSCR